MEVPPEEEEDTNIELKKAWDDVTGVELDPKKVEKARREEIEYYNSMQVYDRVPIQECWRVTGKGPIGVRWIDTDKGKGVAEKEKHRSRLVAQQFNTGPADDMFAATPPTETLKMVISEAATGRGRGRKALMVSDVSRAYFLLMSQSPSMSGCAARIQGPARKECAEN